jgi:catechol 2,3-dioxygenase-like lactoylglutathione lyase family enzyme
LSKIEIHRPQISILSAELLLTVLPLLDCLGSTNRASNENLAPLLVLGASLDRVVGLNDVKTSFAFFRVSDGQANIELIKFHTPSDENGIQQPLANTLGVRHIAFVVEDIEAVVAKLKEKGAETFSEIQDFGKYKLCYVRGPEGIILELAEQIS